MPLPLELRDDDLVDVEEPVFREADLDEGCLHSRQHVVDDAFVDVARDRPAPAALEVDLRGLTLLQDGDTLLADLDGHVDLFLDIGCVDALRRGLPAASGVVGLLPGPSRRRLLALARPPRLGGRLVLDRRGLAGLGLHWRLLPTTAAARAAAPLSGRLVLRLRGGGILLRRRRLLQNRSRFGGSLRGRSLLALLASK